MSRDEIKKLLGGYATGTLTTEEQQALFAAALDDQELFDALGREQALRDLLREPASKAQLLAVLDNPGVAQSAGFMGWLRRPVMATFAMAGVAAVASLAVFEATRIKAPAPAQVAQITREAPQVAAPAQAEAPPPNPASRDEVRPVPAKRKEDVAALRDAGAEGVQAKLEKEVATAASVPVAPPTPMAAPISPPVIAAAPPAAIAETVEVTGDAASMARAPQFRAQAKAATEKQTVDARSLFYGDKFVSGQNRMVKNLSAGPAGAALTAPQASSARVQVLNNGAVAKQEMFPVPSLGVRVSVLRGNQEAAVTTVLNAGESVRLRLTPNVDGFLYVAMQNGGEWEMLASGPAQRLKAFETPPLPAEGAGQKQIYVMLSRQSQTLVPKSLASLARANLIESTPEKDRGTYVVADVQNGPPQQVVQPITLTYR